MVLLLIGEDIQIKKSDKKTAKDSYINRINNLDNKSLILYSDEFKAEENQYASAGVYNLQDNIRFLQNLDKYLEVFDAELFAINKVFKLTSSISQS
ncbi:uncharacterized protein CIMG_13141 [Coccidioides immitis RS]|uniref:Uncharacterized protein n=1 Tax=Coccidioides immitis (strain RS) TaxID=246410 RepID=A0A0E1S2E4_COCIM|nr:uncharacterized protein CIMG_13141 [Coccidioides immitis RS]EAS31892.2 hypothetical protein CIMG_13141 [Coccidioides immitis RS]